MKKNNSKNSEENIKKTKASAKEKETKNDENDSFPNSDLGDKDHENPDDSNTKYSKDKKQETADNFSGEEEPQLNDKAGDNDKDEEKDLVEVLNEEIKEQKDKYIRLMAEFDNYKRRTSKEYERLVELANERLMIDIVEVRESFERALAMTDKNKNFDTFFNGIKLIFNKFDDILTKNGLSVFTEVGDEFNPEIHDALMKSPHEEIPEEHIVQIYEKGYTLKKHVIKHAKVIVSSGKPEVKDENSSDENNRKKSEKQTSK